MDTKYRDFCLKYNQKIKNDKDIKENPVEHEYLNDLRERISFTVMEYTTSPVTMPSIHNHGNVLFRLDEEDLEYLYNKYSKRVKAEMDAKLGEIKDSYKDVL